MPFARQQLHPGMTFPYVTLKLLTFSSDDPKPSLTGGAAVLSPSLYNDHIMPYGRVTDSYIFFSPLCLNSLSVEFISYLFFSQ